jgi:hypothetical protein
MIQVANIRPFIGTKIKTMRKFSVTFMEANHV